RAAVVAVPVGDEPRHHVVEVLPVSAPGVERDRLQLAGEAALLIDAAGAEVLRLVPLERVLGDGLGCWDAGAGARHRRRRGGVTFSRQTHLLLRLRADLPVRGQAVLLLPGLDQCDGAGADLPVHLRAHDLLGSGVVQRALVLHLVPGRDVPEVPRLADTTTLVP